MLGVLAVLASVGLLASVTDLAGRRASKRADRAPDSLSLLVADQLLRSVQMRAMIVTAGFALFAVIFARHAFPLGLGAADGLIYFIAAAGMRRHAARPGAVAGVRGRSLSILANGHEPSLVVTHRMIAAARRKALPEARAT